MPICKPVCNKAVLLLEFTKIINNNNNNNYDCSIRVVTAPLDFGTKIQTYLQKPPSKFELVGLQQECTKSSHWLHRYTAHVKRVLGRTRVGI